MIANGQTGEQIEVAERRIRASLQDIAQALDARTKVSTAWQAGILEQSEALEAATGVERRVVRQLRLIEQLQTELTELAASFAVEAKHL